MSEFASVALGDLDNNGFVDLVVVDNETDTSRIMVFESANKTTGVGWTHIRGDARRTNSYNGAILFSLCNRSNINDFSSCTDRLKEFYNFGAVYKGKTYLMDINQKEAEEYIFDKLKTFIWERARNLNSYISEASLDTVIREHFKQISPILIYTEGKNLFMVYAYNIREEYVERIVAEAKLKEKEQYKQY